MGANTGFGVTGTDRRITGRTTNNSVQVADAVDKDGKIVCQRTYSPITEISEDGFLGTATFTNEATGGQQAADVVTGHNLTEANTDFVRTQKTIRRAPDFDETALTAPTTTTTTTTAQG